MIWIIVILLAIIAATLLFGPGFVVDALVYLAVITGTIVGVLVCLGASLAFCYEAGLL